MWRPSRLTAADSWPPMCVPGSRFSILEVAQLVCDARGGPDPEVTRDHRSGDVRHIVASPHGAAQTLGFRAAVTPAQGLAEFAFAPLRA
jgi:dTDP-L-rhamnose 4-epimerase